ncbi:hypothetical protein F8388_003301 [Cannabis sativa]|uniref:Reverse transcriptase zinc-binding domain-containing protein n=1 Tax=Cannabis sativa TaxID=3483 RepID=A0A7J6E4Y7_CANSA|nr:hypothetical protein F8388_003301 [Cannabis sativa]
MARGLQSLTIQEDGGDGTKTVGRVASMIGGPQKGRTLSGRNNIKIRTDGTGGNELGKGAQENVVKMTSHSTDNGDHPMANLGKNPSDEEVILSLMPNVGPSVAQMLDHPHQKVCKSRTPHQHLEPIPIKWNIGLGLEENMAQIVKGSGVIPSDERMVFSQNEEGIQGQALLGPGQKKRKALVHVMPIDGLGQPLPDALVRNMDSDKIFAPEGSPVFVIGKTDKETLLGGGKFLNNSSSRALQRLRTRPEGWRLKTLSYVGRMTAIKAVALAMPGYVNFLFGPTVGNQVNAIDIVEGLGKDRVVWKRSPKGNFSVKEAYWLKNEYKFGDTHDLWNFIWSKEMHPRASLFLWRMCSGALPTRDKLGIGDHLDCLLCDGKVENPLHVFFECNLAKTLWKMW